MKKTLMARRWKFEGFYRHINSTLSWKFQRKFYKDVFWEFKDGILSSYSDGCLEYSVRYSFFRDDLLCVSFPGVSPYLHYDIKRYLVVRKKKSSDIWLYDTDKFAKIAGFKLAIKLSPIE